MSFLRSALAVVLVAAGPTGAYAKGNDAWRWTVSGGGVYQADASLDSGGDVAVGRYFASASAASQVAEDWRLGVSLGYGETRYEFSGTGGVAGLAPWDRVRELRIGGSVQHDAGNGWTLFGIPSVRFNAETGADLGDGATGGLLAGASYRFSDTLTIGPGFGVFSEIEDDVSWFPILIVDWQISERLSLETGRGFAASRGPGLQLRWRQSPQWQFAFGGRYEKQRFRLDDTGAAPGGVGEDRAIPVFALAEYAASRDVSLSLIAGAEVAGELRLEDSAGNGVAQSDVSTAAFFGATLRASF